MGWNQVRQVRPHPFFDGVPDGANFYFVHSYYVDPTDARGRRRGDGLRPRLPQRGDPGQLVATQFHPEKSGRHGLRLYANFGRLVRGEPAGRSRRRAPCAGPAWARRRPGDPALDRPQGRPGGRPLPGRLRPGDGLRGDGRGRGRALRAGRDALDPLRRPRRLARRVAGQPGGGARASPPSPAAPGVRLQLGGGIRTLEAARAALDAGASRVVLGTAAVERPALVGEAGGRPRRRAPWSSPSTPAGGVVATRGWTAASGRRAVDLARELVELGAVRFIYTDINRDSTLTEPNFEDPGRPGRRRPGRGDRLRRRHHRRPGGPPGGAAPRRGHHRQRPLRRQDHPAGRPRRRRPRPACRS